MRKCKGQKRQKLDILLDNPKVRKNENEYSDEQDEMEIENELETSEEKEYQENETKVEAEKEEDKESEPEIIEFVDPIAMIKQKREEKLKRMANLRKIDIYTIPKIYRA